ncbi:MAG: BamA/TamA family outer membrane protein [Calditrichaceae bacterium]
MKIIEKFNKFKKNVLIGFVVTFSIFLDVSIVSAQGFYYGRNKVQYTDFNWQVLKTAHFDIYYYPEMEDIAEKGARFAEESFAFLETKFNYSITRRIPLIFYSSHLHFQQTNITPGFIPEGVGGFFEFLKGRVVIPSNGDLYQFRRVIRHELVHVFMHSKIFNVIYGHGKGDGAYPPLWFTEGLAELWSGEWDAQGEMVVKDAVLNNYAVGLEQMYQIQGTYSMYKFGQNILGYVADNFGEDKILLMMENAWKYDYFELSFTDATGLNYKQFDREYLYHLKKEYYPMLGDDDFSDQVTETIVRDGYNFKPAYYHDGQKEYVVFVANRTGYSSIYRKLLKPVDPDDKDEVELLVKGETSSDFEAFHIFYSKIDVNDKGLLTFTSKSGESDALYVFDINRKEIISKHYFKGLVAILSPSWSPDGKEIVFSGLDKSGYKDLYLFKLDDTELLRLTNDFYDDTDPSWSPDGNFVAFSSDRTNFGKHGAKNIFVLNKNSGEIFYITAGLQKDQSPVFSPDGQYLAYTSDVAGSYNIYLVREPLMSLSQSEPIQLFKMTSFIGATFDPEWTNKGDLLFGTFENRRFQIRLDRNFISHFADAVEYNRNLSVNFNDFWTYQNIEQSQVESRNHYIKKFDLDIAQTQVSQDPIFGTTGGAQLAITDVLGNDQYYILLYNNSRTNSEFFKSFNAAVSKVSLGQRVNYAVGAFRFAGPYYNPEDSYFYEERIGSYIALSYPLSQFSRLEFNQSFSYSDKDWYFDKRRQAWLNSNFISYVHDNSIWGVTGPIDGRRFNLTIGNTYDFIHSNVNYLTILADLRYYHRLGLRSAYAVRFLSLFNEGTETRQFYLGGSWDLRGYRRWSLRGERVLLISQELRIPFIDLIGIRMPFFSLGFNSIRGAAFFDMGNAWNDEWNGLLGSYGVGIRLRLGNFIAFRWDFGKTTDFHSTSKNIFTQFFFGWDF